MIVPPHTFLGRIPGFLALYYEQPDVYHNVTVHSRNVNGTDPMDPEEGEYDGDGDDYDDSEDEEEEEDESRDENERSDFNMECEKAPDGKDGDGFEFACRYAKKGQNISAASKITSAAKKTTPKPKPKSTPKVVTKTTRKSTPKPNPAPKSEKAPVKKETKKTGGNRKKSVKEKVSKRIDADLSIEDFKEEELQNRLEENIPEQPIDPRLSVDAEGRQVVQFLTENVWSDFYHVDSKNVSSPEVPELRASTPERVFLKCERFNSSSLSGSEKEKKERPSIKLGGLDFACGYVDKTDLKEAMAQGETVEEK